MIPLEIQFRIVSTVALVAWIFMWILPRSRMTEKIVLSGFVCLLLSGFYALRVFIAMNFGDLEKFQSLSGFMSLLQSPQAALAGWIHYLAFDLVVGILILRDSKRYEIPHPFLLVPLVLTFMVGPLGLIFYWILRTFWKRNPHLSFEKE